MSKPAYCSGVDLGTGSRRALLLDAVRVLENDDRVYPVYRSPYEILGKTEVGPPHALARIRTGKEEGP